MSLTEPQNTNLVAVAPGAIRENTPEGSAIQYSDYALDHTSEFAGGAAWIDGTFVPADDAKISIFDTGFGHSDVTYTVPQVWHGNIFRLKDHIDRLLGGAKKLRLVSPLTAEEIDSVVRATVKLSQLREAYVSIILTRGYGRRQGEKDLTKLDSRIYVYAIPYLWVFPPAEQIYGTTAIVPVHVRRMPRNTMDPSVKNFQWGDLTAASFEAKDRGARTAILLDSDGCVAEGPGFNVILVKNGELISPYRNALPGITRKTTFELATSFGMTSVLRDVDSHELYEADELIAVTTAGGITPIIELDGKPIGDGTPGPITTRLRDAYWAMQDTPSDIVEPIEY